MKIISKRGFLLFLFASLSLISFSQTIIRYNTWIGASGCNIFSDPNNASTVINVPASINGTNSTIAHLTATGQPTYDNVNKTVNLVSETLNNGSQNKGTEYRMTVNFKQSYTYKITITAARTMSSQTGANVLLRTDLNNGGSGSNNQCNGTGVIDANGSGNLKKSLQVTNSTFSTVDTNYVFDYVSLSAPQLYLMIAAIPPAASVFQTVLIRRIKIEETPPPVSFTLAPSNVPITCGSTTPVAFTVTNGSGTTGITNYLWNLGASPNGWLLPNGSAAPATYSTGTASTLTLTPVCGATQKNVSVTVTANGNNYNTNTAAVNTTLPDLSINGTLVVCSGSANYSINNLPCNAIVSNWTITSSSNAASLVVNGNTATLNKLTDGSVTLAVDVTACGITRHISKEIQFGAPKQIYTINEYTNPQCYQLGFVYLFYFTPGSYDNQLIDETIWSYQPYDPYYPYPNPATETIVTTPNTFSEHAEIIFQQWGTWQLFVRLKNSCGIGPDPSSKIIEISPYGCGWNFATTPNPATSSIELSLGESALQKESSMAIKEILITDKMGNRVKQIKNSIRLKRQVIDISQLTPGLYYIRVFNGKEWKSKPFIKH